MKLPYAGQPTRTCFGFLRSLIEPASQHIPFQNVSLQKLWTKLRTFAYEIRAPLWSYYTSSKLGQFVTGWPNSSLASVRWSQVRKENHFLFDSHCKMCLGRRFLALLFSPLFYTKESMTGLGSSGIGKCSVLKRINHIKSKCSQNG